MNARRFLFKLNFVAIFCLLVCTLELAFGDVHYVEDLPLTTTGGLPALEMFFDPPNGTFSPYALGLYVWCSDTTATIHYLQGNVGSVLLPTLNSSFATAQAPYIQLLTPATGEVNQTLVVVAVVKDKSGTLYRSPVFTLSYLIESNARPYSYGHLIPGIHSGGYFVQFGIEEAAPARPQAATNQEFANFSSALGVGTYAKQVNYLDLLAIDPDLQGFEGGFTYGHKHSYFGILIPYHDGTKFFGKVVKIDLQKLANNSQICQKSYVKEYYDSSIRRVIINGTTHPSKACIYILDVGSVNSKAVGFRKGFLGYPYGYLSPGQHSVAVRLNLHQFHLNATKFVDLSRIDQAYGGYSGGFADGQWACYVPYRTFVGLVGGQRSTLTVDSNNIEPYYTSTMLCVNESFWNASYNSAEQINSMRTLDFSTINTDLRGFSDAYRVGRYAYLSPLQISNTLYSPYVLRINLGSDNIGASIDAANLTTAKLRSIVTVLNISMFDTRLRGYSSLFSSGKYLFLVPYRSVYEPESGQRGHGLVVRINMNDFTLNGVEVLDLTNTTRNQIPSFADSQLRGYSAGFASGEYALFVPFYNGGFSGKMSRILSVGTLADNLQELDFTVDETHPHAYKAYRGGFVSIWPGVHKLQY